MTDAWTFDDIETNVLGAAVGLLDALIDGCAAAAPGRNAARYAEDLRQLGNAAALAAADVETTLRHARALRQAVA